MGDYITWPIIESLLCHYCIFTFYSITTAFFALASPHPTLAAYLAKPFAQWLLAKKNKDDFAPEGGG